jgi:glycosyltransferase involved in cell wall biosynthesis
LNLIVGTPDVFVALSPTAYTWAKKNYPLGHIQYIPNGININEFEKPYPRLNLEIPKPVVLCVSALLKYKRIELLIKAVSKTKASLVVIGDGPLREELGILGKTFLNHRFKLIPHISHEDIAAYYQACDIFSLPSAPTEAFGLVYLEALASNLPVVAPDDNSRKIIIGGCGVLCNVEDSKAYGLAIEKVLTTNYGNKPREQAQKYSWENIGLQYEKLLNEKLNLYENKV